MRDLWKEAFVRHVDLALASSHEAALEPQHPAGARNGLGLTPARQCVHGLHQVRQGRQSGPLAGDRPEAGVHIVQGVIKSYDPVTGDGLVVRDTDLSEYELSPDALTGSIFRMLRQGQRVRFELDGAGRATRLTLGSEVDMATPDIPHLR
jgi:cold shock CspA family protein